MSYVGKFLFAGALVAAAFSVAAQSHAPARVIVPFAAGGPSDVLARLVAQEIAKKLGQTIVVENKPGATGAIGTQFVADAKPDGLTMLLASSSSMTTGPLLMASVRFNPVKDFIPIDVIATDENLLVVHPSVPAKSAKELIAYAKANPGKLNYSTSGIGSSYHLGTELFNSRLGISMTHVPYKGTAPAVMDLLAGTVQVQFQAISQARAHLAAGDKERPLAIASLARHPDYPEIPTVAESAGLPGFEFATWMGLFFPANTPQPEVARMRNAMQEVMKLPQVRDRILGLGMQPVSWTPEQISAQISGDLVKWGKVIKDTGITLN